MSLLLILLVPSAHAFDPTPMTSIDGAPTGRTYGTGASVAGDVNGDGLDDVLVGRLGAVELYYGAAGATLSPEADVVFAGSVFNPLDQGMGGIGDVNGDGFDDLAVAHNGVHLGDDEVRIHYGSLFGVSELPDLVLTASPDARFGTAFAHGDFDEDGIDDVAIGSPGGNRVTVYLGGTGGLSTTPSYTHVGSSVGHGDDLAVGDANGDGHLDLLVSNEEERGYAVLLRGDGTGRAFARTTLLHDGAVGFADFDGDGVDTPITARGDGVGLHVGADPSFSSALVTFADEVWSADTVTEAADIDGDGYVDVVVAGADHRGVLLGGASGPTSTTVPIFDPSWFGGHASLGDVDGDGHPELVTGRFGVGVHLFLDPMSGGPPARIWAEENLDGSGSFGAMALALGDVDGDGYEDVAVNCSTGVATCVYGGSPTGLGATPTLVLESERAWAAADLDGDGFGDLVVAQPGAVHVHRGGVGGLQTTPDQVLSLPGSVDVATLDLDHDLDGDGDRDLVVFVERGRERLVVVAPNGAAGLGAPRLLMAHPGSFGAFSVAFVGLADVDGDGFPDLIALDGAGTDLVWFAGSSSGPGGPPRPMGLSVAAAPEGLVAGDFDGDGYDDLALSPTRWADCVTSAPCAVVYGSATGPDVGRVRVLGRQPLWAGDLNGDGRDDLVMGTPTAGLGEGEVVVAYGRAGGLPSQPDASFSGVEDEGLGSAATALDVDGDGLRELVVGAPYWDAWTGRLLVFDQ